MADYAPNENFYQDQIKEQEKLKKKLEKASYDSTRQGYVIDGKVYNQGQINAQLKSIETKISSIKAEEKKIGKYGPQFSKTAKSNAAGIAYEKLVAAAEAIKAEDYDSSIASFEAWKKVETFIANNKDIQVVKRVDAIVNNERGRSVRRSLPALIPVKPEWHGQALADAEQSAVKYAEADTTEFKETVNGKGAAATRSTSKVVIDEPLLSVRQSEINAIKNNQSVPETVKIQARRAASTTPVTGVAPAITTPAGSVGATGPVSGATGPISFRAFEERTMKEFNDLPKSSTDSTGPQATGGSAFPTTAPPRTPKIVDWKPKFREMFPSQSWLLDLDSTKYSGLFKLLETGVKDQMWLTPESQARFAAQLQGTDFYVELKTNDTVKNITSLVGDLGFDTVPFNNFLKDAMNFGWKDDTLKQKVYEEAFRKDPATGNYVNATTIERVRKSSPYLTVANIGKAFFNTVSDSTIAGVLTGSMVQDDVVRQQRELAKGKYAHLANLIDQGLSLEDISDSYKTQASKLLEKDPNSIDMSQGAYSQAFDFGEEGKKRLMSTNEWEVKLRSDANFGWDKTQNARDEARALASSISQAFGRVI